MTANDILAIASEAIPNGALVRVTDPKDTGRDIPTMLRAARCAPATLSEGANGVATRSPHRDGWKEGQRVKVRTSGGILAQIDGEPCWVEFDAQGRLNITG